MKQNQFQRPSLDQIISIPDSLTSVYVLERHIWADGGDETARASRKAELRTVEEFLLNPSRSFLNDFFRQISAPYLPERRDVPIGQGWWIQAEFGSGKSHLLSFLGAATLGNEEVWEVIRKKEQEAGQGKRESLYHFYEDGLAKKNRESKGIFVAVKTLVGYGGGGVGLANAESSLRDYILDAVSEQFALENGHSIPIYPTQILADRFLNSDDFELYRPRLAKFLKNPKYFDEDAQQDIDAFIEDLRNTNDPNLQRDCGQRLWDFYTIDQKTRPIIPIETEDVLQNMVKSILAAGYAGVLIILDEVSLYMKDRTASQRAEDEKALVVLANRLAKVENLPVWTVCAAQQAYQGMNEGTINIIARERLDLVPLLSSRDSYYDIALARVRSVTQPAAIDYYYEDYKRSFSWPASLGRDQFARFFPFYPPSMDVLRSVSYNLTTIRSALAFMLDTLKTQTRRKSTDLVTLWALFEEVVNYEEDPSGTARSIASIRTKFSKEWRAFELAIHEINNVTSGPIQAYRSRCEKIVKTLFLYHIAKMAPNGLTAEEIMNAVMEWKKADALPPSDLQDNLDHYENLLEKIDLQLGQVKREGNRYKFDPETSGPSMLDLFTRFKAEAAADERQQREAWEGLLSLDGWEVRTNLMTLDLANGLRSIFREVAPASQFDLTVPWHGREISGRIYMRDMFSIARRNATLPNINSPITGLDYAVFISSTPCQAELDALIRDQKDPRVIFWSPDELTNSEQNLLLDFAAYRRMVAEYRGRDTEEVRSVLEWVKGQLNANLGAIYRMVPESYSRGRIAAQDHTQMTFNLHGELSAILTGLVGQVLDSTYECSSMHFDAPVPFNDANAIKVINGVVKIGEIPRGAKPTSEISAAQNFGFGLGIMRPPNDRKLNTQGNPILAHLQSWLEDKLSDPSTSLAAETVYKNFMGINGADGKSYGLSKRMVQIYLLCLVQAGRIRIHLAGRGMPVEWIDYTNLAGIDFKVAVLDSFAQIQRIKPPEGWETLAPFAARILQDPSVENIHEDAEIQAAVQRLISYKNEALKGVQLIQKGWADLFSELGQANPFATSLAAWEKFFKAPIDPVDSIAYLRNAVEKAFGYPIYSEDEVHPEDLDDFNGRRAELERAERLHPYRERIRAAHYYSRAELPDDPALAEIQAALERLRAQLAEPTAYLASEAGLTNTLLDPASEVIRSYSLRYLQVLDSIIGETANVRMQLRGLTDTPAFQTLALLEQVPQLASGAARSLQARFAAAEESRELFPARVTRSQVEGDLLNTPLPSSCPLTLQNAGSWLAAAEKTLADCQALLQTALLEKAKLLASEALRSRLAQGKGESFLAALLEAQTPEELARVLLEQLAQAPQAEAKNRLELLRRYLQRMAVRKVRLTDFSPSKRAVEAGDVEILVTEFRTFLLEHLKSDGSDEVTIVEIE